MMPRIFAYIAHRDGIVDDSAAELLTAAKKIDTAASPAAIVVGGAGLDAACDSLPYSYSEIWKVANVNLVYPNSELVRQALVSILPRNSLLLVSHDHFGIDLAPGLSIKLESAFVSDVLAIEGVDGDWLKLVRQEFGGQVSTHVRCDISAGGVITIRPGAFKAETQTSGTGVVVDKSSLIGPLSSTTAICRDHRRRSWRGGYHQAQRIGLDWPRHSGKGKCAACRKTCRSSGRGRELLASCCRCEMDGEIPSGRLVWKNREAQGVSGLRHQWRVSAPGRHQRKSVRDRHQQESESSHLPNRRCRNCRRRYRVPAGID